jgi:kynurenine formamidase
LIIRTLPNNPTKLTRQYSGTNPPYLDPEAANWMVEKGIEHLLLDVPSVDREDDGGKLSAHHAFWQYPHNTRLECTITELIYVPASVPDGNYFLNIQIASFENDASPSKPLIFKI